MIAYSTPSYSLDSYHVKLHIQEKRMPGHPKHHGGVFSFQIKVPGFFANLKNKHLRLLGPYGWTVGTVGTLYVVSLLRAGDPITYCMNSWPVPTS